MDIFLGPILRVLDMAIELYIYIVLVGVILSWLVTFNLINTQNRFIYMVGDFTYRATEPLLGRIRRRLPNLGGLDISPLVLIFALFFVRFVIAKVFLKFG